MTATLTTRAPRQIIAGDSIEFLVPVPSDYSGWTGSARLTGPSTMDATSVTASGSDLDVYFKGQGTAPKTASLTAGSYLLTVWATNNSDRVTLAQFNLTVTADLSTGTPTQPFCVRMLAAIEAALYARQTGSPMGAIDAYDIDMTQVTRQSTKELEQSRNKYAAEVQAWNNRNAAIGRLKFGFVSPGALPDYSKRFG